MARQFTLMSKLIKYYSDLVANQSYINMRTPHIARIAYMYRAAQHLESYILLQ